MNSDQVSASSVTAAMNVAAEVTGTGALDVRNNAFSNRRRSERVTVFMSLLQREVQCSRQSIITTILPRTSDSLVQPG